MAGTATSTVRSAFVAESTPGTTPATPGFTTSHSILRMGAPAQRIFGRSQVAQGARYGSGVTEIPVTGTLETPLVYGIYDAWFESLLQSAWSTNVMDDAKSVKTFTVENNFRAGAVTGANTMLRYRGVEAIGGRLNLAANAEAQLSLDLLGYGSDDGTTTAITGATYGDPSSANPMTSGRDVGTITFDGYTLPCMQSLEVNFAFEGREAQPKIGSYDLCGITRGDFLPVLTGRFMIEAGFLSIYNASRGFHTGFEVLVPIGSTSGSKYTLQFHNCRFGEVDFDYSGSTLIMPVPIYPQHDESEGCVLTMGRNVT